MRTFVIALLLVLVACGDAVERGEGKSGSSRSPSERVRTRLPQGRFELPMPYSGAPHLFITLPKGYQVHPTGVSGSDQFFIVSADDPSAQDTAAATPGFMQIYVGEKGQQAGKTSPPRRSAAVIGGRPMLWEMWDESLPDGARYYIREIVTREFFLPYSRELLRRKLELHIYIAGADSTAVNGLVRSAETIRVTP